MPESKCLIYKENKRCWNEIIIELNDKKVEEDRINPELFWSKVRQFKLKNNGILPNDDEIEKLATTRSSINAIWYKGKRYPGCKELYETFKHEAKIKDKAFHRNIKIMKDKGVLTDEIISQCLNGKQNYFDELKELWESLPEMERLSFESFKMKIRDFNENHKIAPTNSELIEMSKRIKHTIIGGDEYGIKEFYEENKFKHDNSCEYSVFGKRLRKYLQCEGEISKEVAIDLIANQSLCRIGYYEIYKVTDNTNGMLYIGATCQGISERWRGHIRNANDSLNPNSLGKAIYEKGPESFKIECLEVYDNLDDTEKREIELIEEYKTLAPNGYNLDIGGKGIDNQSKPIYYEGKSYVNLKALCEVYGVEYKRVESRIRQLGWELDDAINVPKNIPLEEYKKGNLISLRRECKDRGLNYPMVWERINNGWSKEKAMETPKKNIKNKVMIFGLEYDSLSSVSRKFNIPRTTVHSYYKKGELEVYISNLNKRKN